MTATAADCETVLHLCVRDHYYLLMKGCSRPKSLAEMSHFCSLRCNHFHPWHYKFMVSAGTFECISEKSTTNIIIRPYPFGI